MVQNEEKLIFHLIKKMIVIDEMRVLIYRNLKTKMFGIGGYYAPQFNDSLIFEWSEAFLQ